MEELEWIESEQSNQQQEEKDAGRKKERSRENWERLTDFLNSQRDLTSVAENNFLNVSSFSHATVYTKPYASASAIGLSGAGWHVNNNFTI